jgi:hypothetical protein
MQFIGMFQVCLCNIWEHFENITKTCATCFPRISEWCLYVENSKGKRKTSVEKKKGDVRRRKFPWEKPKNLRHAWRSPDRSNLDENLTLSHERYGVLQALGLRSTCRASSALFLPSKYKPTSEPANKMILLETMANAFRACIVSERPNIHTHAQTHTHTHTHTHTQTRKKNTLGGST